MYMCLCVCFLILQLDFPDEHITENITSLLRGVASYHGKVPKSAKILINRQFYSVFIFHSFFCAESAADNDLWTCFPHKN